jgi:hypothetical protein
MNESALAEGSLILQAIDEVLPPVLEARESITEMKHGGSRHWKQMEWIGFYPEFWFAINLQDQLDATRGPEFGNGSFDIQRQFVWDLKSHSTSATSADWAILNDVEAVGRCVTEFDGIGFIILSGPCDYDEDGSFKCWHDGLKGKPTAYQRANEARGARSRKRKIRFRPNHLLALRFDNMDDIERAFHEGWLRGFQKGMRNSNGKARRQKYLLNTRKIEDWAIVDEIIRDSGSRIQNQH